MLVFCFAPSNLCGIHLQSMLLVNTSSLPRAIELTSIGRPTAYCWSVHCDNVGRGAGTSTGHAPAESRPFAGRATARARRARVRSHGPRPDLMGADDAALARLACSAADRRPPSCGEPRFPGAEGIPAAGMGHAHACPAARLPEHPHRGAGPGDELSSLVCCPGPAPWVVVGWRRDAGVECPRARCCCCARPASVLGRLLACGF